MMKTAALVTLGFAAASASFIEQETKMNKLFATYVAQYNKSYGTVEEYELRKELFAKKHFGIEHHNAQGKSFELAHNHMSDWTEAEYKDLLGYKSAKVEGETSVLGDVEIPATMDWRSLNSMSVIKDQGHCGSCWAFSTIGSVESHTEIMNNEYTSLSEQQLVDCSPYTLGCEGGNYFFAFSYLKTNGSESEKDYPYTAADGTCSYDAAKVANHHVDSYNFVTPFNTSELRAHIAQGPVSIAIEADEKTFQHYSTGVIAIADCGNALDHAVLAIGYGTEAGQDYILVRNSWGPTWGDHGTVKLAHNASYVACGASTEPAFVITK